jgi:multicomponent K+:H+ antiporter subunit F
MLITAGWIAGGLLAFASLCCLWRLVHGPSALDRVLAADTLAMNSAGLVIVYTVVANRAELFDLVFLLALLGLLSTLSLARFIEQGRLSESPFTDEVAEDIDDADD